MSQARKILITGACSLVSKVICHQLMSLDYELYGIDVVPENSFNKLSGIHFPGEYYQADLTNRVELTTVLEKIGHIDIAILLTDFPNIYTTLQQIIYTDPLATEVIYDACKKNNICKIILGSSLLVTEAKESVEQYKKTSKIPFIDNYIYTKIYSEQTAKKYAHNITTIIMRLGDLNPSNKAPNDQNLPWCSHDYLLSFIRLAINKLLTDDVPKCTSYSVPATNIYQWLDLIEAKNDTPYFKSAKSMLSPATNYFNTLFKTTFITSPDEKSTSQTEMEILALDALNTLCLDSNSTVTLQKLTYVSATLEKYYMAKLDGDDTKKRASNIAVIEFAIGALEFKKITGELFHYPTEELSHYPTKKLNNALLYLQKAYLRLTNHHDYIANLLAVAIAKKLYDIYFWQMGPHFECTKDSPSIDQLYGNALKALELRSARLKSDSANKELLEQFEMDRERLITAYHSDDDTRSLLMTTWSPFLSLRP